MRLKALTVKNFKGIDEKGIRIELAPISLLFGPNNAGKSTILQALHLARVIFCHRKSNINKIDALGNVLNIGSFEDYVHLHDKDRVVTLSLDFSLGHFREWPSAASQRFVDCDLLDPLCAFDDALECQRAKNFENPEQATEQTKVFITAFDTLADAVEHAAKYLFGPIGEEQRIAQLKELEKFHRSAIHIVKQADAQRSAGAAEADYDKALQYSQRYCEDILKYACDGHNALMQRENKLHRLIVPLAKSLFKFSPSDLSAVSLEELKLHADEITKSFDALFESVTQEIEAILPFMPLDQQQFETKRLKKYYDRATVAMEQLAETMLDSLASMPHEQQKTKRVSIETHYDSIVNAIRSFNNIVLAFITEGDHLNEVIFDISIYQNKELNTTAYDFSYSFQSELRFFARQSSELRENIEKDIFHMTTRKYLLKLVMCLLILLVKFVDIIEHGCKKLASTVSAKFPALEAPLKKLGKLIMGCQVDRHSLITTGEFIKNKAKLDKIGDSLIKFGNKLVEYEEYSTLSDKEKYFATIKDLDQAIEEGRDTQKYLGRKLGLLMRMVQDFLSHSLYIGPLRSIPRRGAAKTSLMQYADWAEGNAAWDKLRLATEEQINAVNSAMHGPGSLETGYTIRYGSAAQGKHLLLHNERSQIIVEPHDVGTGVSQILPVVTAAVLESDALIMVAQPELHIHPKLQANLGDIFIRAAQNNGSRFLLETHSEHLLLRLLKRIRHTNEGKVHEEELKLKHTDLSVNWIGNEDGHTYAIHLEVDKDGSFNTPWPEGFFDERGEELFG